MYFNIKYERTGKLFERAFLSEHASLDPYLKHLFSYIHLNPAKILESKWKEIGIRNLPKVRDFVENYEFSSYRNYLGEKDNVEILHRTSFPDYFSVRSIKEEMDEWLNYDTKVTPL